ncbi:MAG: YbjN domain-containing protein, partial [Cyanobacteria bacterium J06598_1]
MLTLFDPTASPISIQSIQLDNTEKDFAQLVVNFQVDLAEYTLIDTKALFNLQPDLRGPFLKGDFLPTHPIKITAVLHPDHLPEVLKKAATLEVAVDYLEKLSTQHQDLTPASMETIDSLLKTENWLALTVQQ